MVHVNDIAFGLEVETHIDNNDSTHVGPYHNGHQVHWLPAGWKAERDGSINCPYGRQPCEFVSPKLKGAAGIAQAHAAVEAIKARGEP